MLNANLDVVVGADTYSMSRINQDNNASDFFARAASGANRLSLSVKHTLPTPNEPGESHLIRLDLDRHDAEGIHIRTDSVWVVMKCTGGSQDTTELNNLMMGLVNVLTTTDLGSPMGFVPVLDRAT